MFARSFEMNCLLSIKSPQPPIIFDFANFLIKSGKVDDYSSYGPIITRLGFNSNTFIDEMRAFAKESSTSKKTFVINKVGFCNYINMV